jgi:hypothetical protein
MSLALSGQVDPKDATARSSRREPAVLREGKPESVSISSSSSGAIGVFESTPVERAHVVFLPRSLGRLTGLDTTIPVLVRSRATAEATPTLSLGSAAISPWQARSIGRRRLGPTYRADERHEPEVDVFLERNPQVGQVLREADAPLRRRFGDDATARLRVMRDPEAGHRELIVGVVSNLPRDVARTALEGFEDDWWLDRPEFGMGLVQFVLD